MPKKITLADIQKMASDKNGICLSDTYVSSRKKMKFKCHKGHKFSITSNSLQQGRWCRKCSGKMPLTQKQVEKLISTRGGIVLSIYINSHTDIKVRCKFEHEFSICVNDFRGGQWCKDCSSSVSERICREYFEQIFKKPFPNVRPKWLLGNKGFSLELDGYCSELNLAFEHNGMQHYSIRPHQTQDGYISAITNDAIKKEIAKKIGLKLIVIPALFRITKLKNLKEYIKQECIKLDILPDNFDSIEIDSNKAYYNISMIKTNNSFKLNNSKYTINDVLDAVNKKGGKCVSTIYNPYEMDFECAKGHAWTTTSGSILAGTWCQQCYYNRAKDKQNLPNNDISI